MLFQQLDLSGLEGWSNKNQATHALLAEYHNIFSLKPGELGCTDLVKYELLMMNPSNTGSEEFPYPWWMRSGSM